MGEPGVEFDARKFEYLGAYTIEVMAYVFTKASGITNINKLMSSKTLVKVGGTAPGAFTDNALRVLKMLGFPIHIVSGYKGSAKILLAVESGEVAGTSVTWYSLKVIQAKNLAKGDLIVMLVDPRKITAEYTLEELLPDGFGPEHLK